MADRRRRRLIGYRLGGNRRLGIRQPIWGSFSCVTLKRGNTSHDGPGRAPAVPTTSSRLGQLASLLPTSTIPVSTEHIPDKTPWLTPDSSRKSGAMHKSSLSLCIALEHVADADRLQSPQHDFGLFGFTRQWLLHSQVKGARRQAERPCCRRLYCHSR